VVIEVVSNSPDETLDIGRRIARVLRAGDVVLLSGRLGSGKTLLAGGIAEGMGVQEPVTSPSFVIVHEYDGFLKIVHADMYRLGSIGEFDDLDLTSVARDGVLIIEWGDAVAVAIADHLLVSFEISGESSRTLRFAPMGTWVDRSLEELAE
jgi:tRNA threonylcarbamoyladenosine biosynthesis protein TsaE